MERHRNVFARQFLISWLSVLHSVPHLDLVAFLPDLLDGLLAILEDPTAEIKKTCQQLLGELLLSIVECPRRVDFASMINILIHHSQSDDQLLRVTASLGGFYLVLLSFRDPPYPKNRPVLFASVTNEQFVKDQMLV